MQAKALNRLGKSVFNRVPKSPPSRTPTRTKFIKTNQCLNVLRRGSRLCADSPPGWIFPCSQSDQTCRARSLAAASSHSFNLDQRRRPDTFWLWIILIGGGLGALAYIFILTIHARAKKNSWCDVGTDPPGDPAVAGEIDRLLLLLRK